MSKLVALTFDDGHSDTTPKILDILEAKKVRGTFFLVGEHISEDTKYLLDRQLSLGCEICNHSLTHSHMPELTADVIAAEIEETTAKIMKLGAPAPKFFRPPFLEVNQDMFDRIPLNFIAGADIHDWEACNSPEKRIQNVMDMVRDGAIILMHDFCGNDNTVIALPTIIDKLAAEGYEFVTVSELFERKGINPAVKGKVWSYVE
ncbi:MAG: polysaccharide deacetylase family protein [Clostridia bacterium]|nr:polysaccharide deacetylase family protein [Clostridia bacterium]